jgi:hypothetical protein
MQKDYLGNPISAAVEATRAAIDDFIGGLLAYETRAEHVLGAADADPDCCLVNVYAGFLWMLLEAPEAAQRAAKYLSAAERAAGGASLREQTERRVAARLGRRRYRDGVAGGGSHIGRVSARSRGRQAASIPGVQSRQRAGNAAHRAQGHRAQCTRRAHARNGRIRLRTMPFARRGGGRRAAALVLFRRSRGRSMRSPMCT